MKILRTSCQEGNSPQTEIQYNPYQFQQNFYKKWQAYSKIYEEMQKS